MLTTPCFGYTNPAIRKPHPPRHTYEQYSETYSSTPVGKHRHVYTHIIHAENISDTMYFSFSPSPPSTSYATMPMEIPSSSKSRPQSPSCAYPSWPRRSSLSSNSSSDDDAQSTSFIISDEELFPCVFDEAEQDCTPPATPSCSRSPASPSMMCEMVVETGSLMRHLVAEEKAKKERRRRRSTSSKKSRSGSGASKGHMSPIQEVVE